jgi:hypothetical protein
VLNCRVQQHEYSEAQQKQVVAASGANVCLAPATFMGFELGPKCVRLALKVLLISFLSLALDFMKPKEYVHTSTSVISKRAQQPKLKRDKRPLTITL